MWSLSRNWGHNRLLAVIMQKLWRYLVRLERWAKLSRSYHLNWALWRPWSNLWSFSCRKGWSCKNRGRKNCKRISNTRCERARGNRSIKVVGKRIVNGLRNCKKGWRIGPDDSCSYWRRGRRCYFDHYHHHNFSQEEEKPTIELEIKAKRKVRKWTKWLATRRRNSHALKCFKQRI